jgi:hypothetical protein
VSFLHEDPEFGDLLRIVAAARRLAPGLVEKDYWVTHTLWSLQRMGLEIWFKGGTSLSKGFGLIERFSEDLDLQIEPGSASAPPAVSSWRRPLRVLSESAPKPGLDRFFNTHHCRGTDLPKMST